MQHFLKPAARVARAWIVPAHLVREFLVAVNQPLAALHVGFAQGTPGAACSSAQKESRASRSFRCLTIEPPGGGRARNLVGLGRPWQPNGSRLSCGRLARRRT